MLAGVQVHDAPPAGPYGRRVAVIQDHATGCWALTAQTVHPGIGMSEPAVRDRYATGLTALIDAACATELVSEVIVMVRTVPEDGAERDAWTARHRTSAGPAAARTVNDELQASLTSASVRTETFVTVVVPEARIARPAKEAGGGFEGRARVLTGLTGEVEAHLRGGLGMSEVTWLTSPELAAACRTGFAPGDRASIIDAVHAAATDQGVNADVPWAMAGPSGADPVARHYSHDAWNSISATLKLPVKGAVMGALAPVLVPGPGERRCFAVVFPIVTARAADRQSASGEWKADMADGLRAKAKVKQRTRAADDGPPRPRPGPQARPRQRPDPALRRRHRHRRQDRPDRRARPPPRRLDPRRRVRPAAPGPVPGRRVRHLHHPARDLPGPERGVTRHDRLPTPVRRDRPRHRALRHRLRHLRADPAPRRPPARGGRPRGRSPRRPRPGTGDQVTHPHDDPDPGVDADAPPEWWR